MGLVDKLRGVLGFEKPGSGPAKQESEAETNLRIAETAYPPEARKKVRERVAASETAKVAQEKTTPESELARIRELIPYFAQPILPELSDKELTKLQTQVEKAIADLSIVPISEGTEEVKKILEEKKDEIISTLGQKIERQAKA